MFAAAHGWVKYKRAQFLYPPSQSTPVALFNGHPAGTGLLSARTASLSRPYLSDAFGAPQIALARSKTLRRIVLFAILGVAALGTLLLYVVARGGFYRIVGVTYDMTWRARRDR